SKCSLIRNACQSYFDPGFNLSKSLCSGTSAFAVLRLTTSSNFVARSIGKSPALAPFRILSMNAPNELLHLHRRTCEAFGHGRTPSRSRGGLILSPARREEKAILAQWNTVSRL